MGLFAFNRMRREQTGAEPAAGMPPDAVSEPATAVKPRGKPADAGKQPAKDKEQ